ncbi:MAG: flavin reductase family protein [Alphaproteobacteria bacterium]|jgi:flavin reductase (DIM6/NTAB) family NADH-FMN oxidoreductase RutF|nr:flavin reductase family protein [Alphaproteobacteria bacterium]
MFHKIGTPHGLPHDPFKSCVVPRPIGWISSLSADGTVNLAPYSFFNALAGEPPMVMFSSNGKQPFGPKDSLANIEATGEFVCSMATWDLRDSMSATSAAERPEVDEFELTGLETEPSQLVKPPRVKASPVHLECLYHTTVELPCDVEGGRNAVCIGRVVGIHIRDEFLVDGLVDIARIRPLARMGYQDYTVVEQVFTMAMPK